MQPKSHHKDTSSSGVDLPRVQTAALVIIAFAVVLFLLVQARFMLISLATAIMLFSLTSAVIDFIAPTSWPALPRWSLSLPL